MTPLSEANEYGRCPAYGRPVAELTVIALPEAIFRLSRFV